MYTQVGKVGGWKRVAVPALVIMGGFGLPMAFFFIYVMANSGDFATLTAGIFFALLSLTMPLHHLRNLYLSPLIEMDDHFIVTHYPFQRSRIYRLKHVTKVRRFMKSVIFLHGGLPVLLNLHSIEAVERDMVINALASANPGGLHPQVARKR